MSLPLSLSALLLVHMAVGDTTNIKASSCCAAHGGCIMNDQILDFPANATNPPEFDYKVTGTLPRTMATGTYHLTGALAGVKVADKKGTACGTQTIVIRELIKLATVTIVFPPCPDQTGPLLVTGHVSVPIAPPLGTVFKTNILVADPTGAAIACLDIDVGGGSASPAAVAATGCCPTGGCDLSPQTLNFPAQSSNPISFDFDVTGNMAASVPATAPTFSFVGSISSGAMSAKIANAKGTACGDQVVKLSYLSVDIGTSTIHFAKCPWPAGAQKVTGSVSTHIGLPDSALFDAHIEVHDDKGGMGSCIDVHVTPATGPAPGPSPPAPVPPPTPPTPAALYACVSGQCVANPQGVSKQVCLAACS